MQFNFRSRLFWVLFSIFSLICIATTVHFFPKAIPLIHLDLTMDRSEAQKRARNIAQQFNFGPENGQQAVMFHTDTLVKTFIELEGGGKDNFVSMMKQNLYQPYTWQVRNFTPYQVHESIIRFTPDGIPYGFVEKLAEDIPGTNLDVQNARLLAEYQAINNWHIDFAHYTLIEQSKEIRLSERIDHTFVYERIDHKIGDGYRLRIVVSGDKVTELTHFVQIPDSFKRQYQEMRTANDTIAWFAQLVMLLIYILGGCIIGLLILFKQHWVIWQTPIMWGAIIALLDNLTMLNNIPLLWFAYPTALSPYGFLLNYLTSMLYQFLYKLIFYSLIFMAAESLTRKAFGNQLQLWKLWNKDYASSLTVWGYTIGGYLIVPIHFAFISFFYIFTTQYLNWWVPSDTLFDPNVLATYVPWFSSLATALRAGFMEECLFRAVPLASAALLGAYYGRKNIWIIFAFVIQALIFGAAHANYPMQPAYARVIELIVPSSIFGGLYLAFGLLPAIISHVIYDVVWMSLPIFISTAPWAWINQLIVIMLALLPMWIILFARLKEKKWFTLGLHAYNKAWQPLIPPKQVNYETKAPELITFTLRKQLSVYVLGLAACSVWLYTTQFRQDAPALGINRTQAEVIARTYLNQQNIHLNTQWRVMTAIDDNDNANVQHVFVWQEAGQLMYQKLLGNYLTVPHWVVRFAQFNGDIVARAEEYHAFIQPNGTISRMNHLLPESAPGMSLDENSARILAFEALQQHFNLESTDVIEISAIPQQKPARKDWIFVFAQKNILPIDGGQARIKITIAGNEITDWQRLVHVPELWQRDFQNKQNITHVITQLSGLLIYLFFIIGMAIALLSLTFSTNPFTSFFVFCFIGIWSLLTINTINSWPAIIVKLVTSKPWFNQLFITFGSLGIGILIKAIVFALTISFVSYVKTKNKLPKNISTILLGISLGILLACIENIFVYLLPTVKATWADYDPLNTFVPLFAQIYNVLIPFISFTTLWLLLATLVNYHTQYGIHKKFSSTFILCASGFLFAGILYADNLILYGTFGLAFGITLALLYFLVIRFDLALIPLIVGTQISLRTLQHGLFHAYPFSFVYAISNVCVIACIAWLWFKKLNR